MPVIDVVCDASVVLTWFHAEVRKRLKLQLRSWTCIVTGR